ncbi:deaminase [Spiroplasma sp. BIUS-1]|uniref:deaminase n=1 Tax=Spiroplasma sp. BIUS-1 TaxID=216964 RepID=UPI0013980D94|nr:deaminase [Spiroplasma sp. BIUS-1]QHX36259.1 tRNA-specific adenosine deaminase [Spiroplasma sp. BIUS-1]
MDNIFNVLNKEITKCSKTKDVPVAALILNNKNEVIHKDSNTRQKNFNFTDHAEVKVLNKIYKKLKTKNLKEYTLVTTLKPCLMCLTVIEEANIKKVMYYLDNLKCNYNKLTTNIEFVKIGSVEETEYFEKQLKEFFSQLRK